jgi:hypothetical protein
MLATVCTTSPLNPVQPPVGRPSPLWQWAHCWCTPLQNGTAMADNRTWQAGPQHTCWQHALPPACATPWSAAGGRCNKVRWNAMHDEDVFTSAPRVQAACAAAHTHRAGLGHTGWCRPGEGAWCVKHCVTRGYTGGGDGRAACAAQAGPTGLAHHGGAWT